MKSLMLCKTSYMEQFECKKVNNCFKDAITYAYRLPYISEALMEAYKSVGEVTINNQFRRPSFTASFHTVRYKGILMENIIKASFLKENWEEEKEQFEIWLAEILEQEEKRK